MEFENFFDLYKKNLKKQLTKRAIDALSYLLNFTYQKI